MSGLAIRQNYHQESEVAVNKQINIELYASYIYHSMYIWFDRSDVALPGFAKFFKHNSDEEREHAEKFMKLQNKRGGSVVLQTLQRPDRDEWGTGLDALVAALELEKKVNQSLLNLHSVASTHEDPYFCDFIESEFLNEQVEAIKDLGDKINELKRAGPGGLGEYLFDQKLQQLSSFETK